MLHRWVAWGTFVAAIALLAGGAAIVARIKLTEDSRRNRIKENGRAVVSAMKEIARAFDLHLQKRREDGEMILDLTSMRRFPGEIPPEVFAADCKSGRPVPYCGYFFDLVQATKDGEFFLCAYPAEYEETGTKTWILFNDLRRGWGFWQRDVGGKPVHDVSDEELSSWWSREGCG